jgi:hypothetical protein
VGVDGKREANGAETARARKVVEAKWEKLKTEQVRGYRCGWEATSDHADVDGCSSTRKKHKKTQKEIQGWHLKVVSHLKTYSTSYPLMECFAITALKAIPFPLAIRTRSVPCGASLSKDVPVVAPFELPSWYEHGLSFRCASPTEPDFRS